MDVLFLQCMDDLCPWILFVFCHIFLLIVVLSTMYNFTSSFYDERSRDQTGIWWWTSGCFKGWIWTFALCLEQKEVLLSSWRAFFQAQQFGFDFRSHIWYKCISCCFHEIYVISLSTGIWKEERKQDYRKLWKKADLLTGGFLWFLSMIKCPLNSKVELCQLDSNALR